MALQHRHKAHMPVTYCAQIGFPVWPHTVAETPDHILAEELDEVGHDAAFQFLRPGASMLDSRPCQLPAHKRVV